MAGGICAALSVAALLPSCAPALKARFDMTASQKIVWPGEPEKPRVSYLWSLQEVGELAEGRRGFADVVAGRTLEDVTDPRTSNILLRPQEIFVDAKRYYIADPGAARLTVIDRKTMDVFHIIEGDDEDLVYPRGVVADEEGIIYVSDSDLKKVLAFDPMGKFRFAFEGEFARPEGLAIDQARGIVYVVDTNAHVVYRYGKDGKRLGSVGGRGSGDGEFNYPTYACADSLGRLYVTDFLNFRIQVFSPDGVFVKAFGMLGDTFEALEKPKGVAVDTEGHIYVVDNAQDTVKIFNQDGQLLLFFGNRGHDLGEFYMPTGIHIDGQDIIYIADTINMRIQAFKFLGGN